MSTTPVIETPPRLELNGPAPDFEANATHGPIRPYVALLGNSIDSVDSQGAEDRAKSRDLSLTDWYPAKRKLA